MAKLELTDVAQRYDTHHVVRNVGFQLEPGTIACLLGPSGCGKTTLLRCIAGFEDIISGEIRIRDQLMSRPGYAVPPEKRRVGMVFQDYALFPHLTVAGNIAFGIAELAEADRMRRVDELLARVGLTGQERKYPHELSGGQQQRVALARALAPRPELVLLDEPFSNLDIDLRERLAMEVREILKNQGVTAVMVTHDQHEAFTMADEIGVMFDGEIQQWDTPYNLYHHPANRFVADFVGLGAFVPGKVVDAQHVAIPIGIVKSATPLPWNKDSAVEVLLRPNEVVLDDNSTMRAEILHKAFRGAEILYSLRLPDGSELLSLVSACHNHALGEQIGVSLNAHRVTAFATGD